MKKLFAILCMLTVAMFIGTISQSAISNTLISCAYAEDLGIAKNLRWKSGSSATAAWDEVEAANYYLIDVSVFYNHELIGEKATGTSDTEIDLQQEIHSIVGNANYDVVTVSFSITPAIIYDNGKTDIGSVSSCSTKHDYLLAYSGLAQPSGLTLDNNCVLSWDNDPNVNNHYFYDLFFYRNGTYVGDIYGSIYSWETNNGRSSYDFMTRVKSKFITLGLTGQNITIKAHLKPYGTVTYGGSTYTIEGELSAYSNSVICRIDDEVPTLGKPTGLMLENNCVLSWDDDPNVNNHYFYDLFFYRNGTYVGDTYGSIYSWETSNGRSSYDFMTKVKSKFITLGLTGQDITIKAHLKPYGTVTYGGSTYTIEGELSAYSNSAICRIDGDVPTIGKPTGLMLDNNCVLSWDNDPNVNNHYFYDLFFYRNGTYVGDIYGSIYSWETNNERSSYDFMTKVKSKFITLGLTGQDITIKAHLKPYSTITYGGSTYTIEGELSSYSNSVVYNTQKKPESIRIAPRTPILYLGNSLYLGKTITPEDAYYTTINWSTSDNSIVPISTVGRITGTRVGTATITAAIGDVTDSVEVTVYDISSNIEDPSEQDQVTDTAGGIIDDIVNTDDPDLGNTDIDAGDLPEIREDIQEGIWRGDEFFTDVVWYEENFSKYKDNWGQIQKAARELNAEFAGAYNVEVEMYHKDDAGTDYHIGNITELPDEITFTFDLPTGMKEQQAGYARKYVLVRIHKNNIEAIDAVVNEDGTVTTKSDCFSDFILLYVDEKMDAIDLSGYTAMNLPAATTTIEAEAFEGIAAEVVFIPENCSSIGYHAFANCPNLVYVVVTHGSDVVIDDAALEGTNARIIYQ